MRGGGGEGGREAREGEKNRWVVGRKKEGGEKAKRKIGKGGIAGVMDPEDRFEDHIADTVTAGGALCDESVVEMVVREAPERIQELIRWGTNFDLESGELMLGREGGHSRHRIVHALGDATGKEIMRAEIGRAHV